MKNRRFLLIVIFFLVICSTSFPKTIRVAYQNNFYPYSWTDPAGKPNGFLLDWWKLWAQKAKVDVLFVGGSGPQCISMVLNDSADALAGMYFELDMANHLQFGEYIIRLKSILFLEDGYKPASPEMIKKPIGMVRNEVSEQLVISRFPGLKLNYFDNFRVMKYQIEKHAIAGFIYEYPDLRAPYKALPPPKGYYKYLEFRADKLRPAVKEGNDTMIRLLMVGAAQITDKDLELLVTRYPFIQRESPFPWNGVIIGGSFLVVLIAFIVFILLRRKQRAAEKERLENEWQQMIAAGESDKVEFKSSMRWDYRQEKVNKTLEYVIAKTISAFLNTAGGTLFIGVDDKGGILGLDPDYQTLSKKNSDGFLLALTDVVNRFLGKELHRFIKTRIIVTNEKEICMITVVRSDTPVFVEKESDQEFFIRTPASSQPLNMREAMEYISSHWSPKK